VSREIDAAVAEHVMGWTECDPAAMWGLWEHGDPGMWEADPGNGMGIPPGARRPEPCPRYSTDIAAAWLVVEKMRAEGFFWDVFAGGNAHGLYIGARFDNAGEDEYGEGGIMVTAYANTAPMAIALAALKAKGITIPDRSPTAHAGPPESDAGPAGPTEGAKDA
jgi:hypothetical protein